MESEIIPIYLLPRSEVRQGEGGYRYRTKEMSDQRQEPLISIVTVVLNGEKHIERTIQSIIDQLDERFEYIVIDGGSEDSTVEIIRKNEQQLEYWVSETDFGIGDAFNKGISLCRGSVIGLLNAGDWLEEQVLNWVAKFFREGNDTEVLCGSLQYWQGNTRAFISESRPELLGREMSVTHPTCFIKREIYQRYGGFNPEFKFAMDYELLLRFYVQGVVFLSTERVLANMLHEGVSEQNWQKALIETRLARKKHLPGSFFAGRMYLFYLIVRKYIRFVLQSLGMKGLVRFYKERLAPVKKRMPE